MSAADEFAATNLHAIVRRPFDVGDRIAVSEVNEMADTTGVSYCLSVLAPTSPELTRMANSL